MNAPTAMILCALVLIALAVLPPTVDRHAEALVTALTIESEADTHAGIYAQWPLIHVWDCK